MQKTISIIKKRKSTQARAAAAGRAAAAARGAAKPKPKPKPKPKSKPAVRTVKNRAPTPAQKVPSISGGTGARAKRILELEARIRELEKGGL